MTANYYAAAIRDEVWIGGKLAESRLSCGHATIRGNEIVATDRSPDTSLRDACDAESDRVRDVVRQLADARVRVMIRACSDATLESSLTIAIAGVSIVTTPDHATADAAMLRDLLARPAATRPRPESAPLLWRNGSAAVLLHEAAGHAAEHGHLPVAWPAWLRVHDGASDLLAGDAPRTLRRETFRDVPLPRMTSVIVTHDGAPFQAPSNAVEIELVAGGAYEPLTEIITVDVAMAFLDGRRLPPFLIRAGRANVARSIAGATGSPIRYPGVICSREGQELFVGSYAPLLLTGPLS